MSSVVLIILAIALVLGGYVFGVASMIGAQEREIQTARDKAELYLDDFDRMKVERDYWRERFEETRVDSPSK